MSQAPFVLQDQRSERQVHRPQTLSASFAELLPPPSAASCYVGVAGAPCFGCPVSPADLQQTGWWRPRGRVFEAAAWLIFACTVALVFVTLRAAMLSDNARSAIRRPWR